MTGRQASLWSDSHNAASSINKRTTMAQLKSCAFQLTQPLIQIISIFASVPFEFHNDVTWATLNLMDPSYHHGASKWVWWVVVEAAVAKGADGLTCSLRLKTLRHMWDLCASVCRCWWMPFLLWLLAQTEQLYILPLNFNCYLKLLEHTKHTHLAFSNIWGLCDLLNFGCSCAGLGNEPCSSDEFTTYLQLFNQQ